MSVRATSGERKVPTKDTTILYPVTTASTISYVDLTCQSSRDTLRLMKVRVSQSVVIYVCDGTSPSLKQIIAFGKVDISR